VDAAENDESKAYAVNAEALALLADEAKRLDALVVHYLERITFLTARSDRPTKRDR